MSVANLRNHYQQLRQEATQLAGGLTDLAQRATVYRHLFLASGRNHAFPLIAAHGALWAGGYFRSRMKFATWLSLQYVGQPQLRQQRLRSLDEFANVFRDINRRVCIDTYVNFHFTRRFGLDPEVTEFVPAELVAALNQIHAACAGGRNLDDSTRRSIFEAHFYHEQKNVVGPVLLEAVEKFDWPLVRSLALRPTIRFAFFPRGEQLVFKNFSRAEERIANGLKAFELAAQVGWNAAEAALKDYDVLPAEFFERPTAHFEQMRNQILACGT